MTKIPLKFYSLIFGRKGIVKSETHQGLESSLRIQVAPEMVPSSNLVVYYYQPSGEIVFNQIKLEFEQVLGNFVSAVKKFS